MKVFRFPFSDIRRNFQPVTEYFKKNLWSLVLGLISLLAVDFLQLLIPLVIKRAIDILTVGKATGGILLRYAALIAAIALGMAFLRYLWRYLLLGLSRKIEEGLRNRLYSHLQTLSMAFYQRTKTGDLMARTINDINAIRMATGMGLVALTDGIVLGMAAIGFMLSISPVLTLLSLIPAPIIIVLSKVMSRRIASGFERVQRTFSDLTEGVREAFAGIRVVKAYSRESWQYGKVEGTGRKYVSENMKLARTFAIFIPMITIFTNLGLAVVIGLGGRLTILGHITTGDFVAFISYLNLLAWPMMALGWVTNMIQRGATSMRRINGILEEIPEITDTAEAKGNIPIRGGIEFIDLRVRYPGQTDEAIKGINLTVKAGQTVSVVGRIGSGKTSLFHALARFHNVPKGRVFLDGRDIHEIPLKTLRKAIGFATQEAVIFSDTVRNNVIFGRTGISDEILFAALKTAQLIEEIQQLENGVDTLLGERGITLSGGQRQRVSIARAILADPPILILDDALSMVDTRTEEEILNDILGARNEKTNLIVSHRLSTISRADRIVVLERGAIVETGDHDALIKRGTAYARLYERQLLAKELEM
ncbi:MAG: ABC transporter ATP-binding protein [Desulfatiglandales bacterium]